MLWKMENTEHVFIIDEGIDTLSKYVKMKKLIIHIFFTFKRFIVYIKIKTSRNW